MAATPSQWPLLSRADAIPRPNVMLTLDDSGSMTYQYLPERPFKVNGFTVNFPIDAKVFLNPWELKQNIFSSDGGGADTFYVTAAQTSELAALSNVYPNAQIIQMQMRSPQVNGMYYNPDALYTPWQNSDGTSYANATVTQAWLDQAYLQPGAAPTNPATNTDQWVDLTQDRTASVRWYCSTDVGAPNYNNGACAQETLSYSPALLYLLQPAPFPACSSQTIAPTSSASSVIDLNVSKVVDPNQACSYQPVINLNAINGSITYKSTLTTPARTDCTITGQQFTCTKAAELQNFANWFVYYRSRIMTAKGAIPQAFSSLSDNVRVGWGTIHPGTTSYYPDGQSVSGTSYPSNTVQQSVRTLDTTQKANLTTWMRSLQTYRGTPSLDALLSVGTYFQRGDRYGPWATDPVQGLPADTTAQLSCRRNYNILITDGYYNTYPTLPVPDASQNADGANIPPNYTAAAPFKDSVKNTMADFAMYFWANDLLASSNRPATSAVPPVTDAPMAPGDSAQEIADLTPIKNDPATWRHLSQLMIGFGVSGTIVSSDPKANDDALWALSYCGKTPPPPPANASAPPTPKCWPTTSPPDAIDDLWHAAINSRGAFFSVTHSDQLQTALASALTATTEATAQVAGVTTDSRQLIAGNIKYVPEYQPVAWTGNVRAWSLDASGNNVKQVWDAASVMPAPSARNIVVWDSSASAASPFLFSSMSTNTKKLLGAQVSDALVSYLRGANNTAWTQFRSRATPATNPPGGAVLTDFVNSPPLLIQPGQGSALYYGKDLSLGNASSTINSDYSVYLTYKTHNRTNSTLFVGGNGGMLHAFNATASPAGPALGQEVFAFVPETGLPNLATIASRGYGSENNYHQYFVDGPLIEADAYFQARGQTAAKWNDVVVGTMGAGGTAVFALNLDWGNPNNLSASSVLWESTGTANPDMGYITSTPQVGMLPDGSWKVFVGNGADSTSGKAALLMIDMQTGVAQSLPVGSGAAQSNNGLGGITLVRDDNNEVIGAYAGDLQGNLWRFEWDYVNNQMVVGYGGQTLFQAQTSDGTGQPITTAPLLAPNPNGGNVVVFNTGKLLDPTDSTDTTVQSAYGIWDRNNISQMLPTAKLTPPTITRANLQTQSIYASQQVTFPTTVAGVTTATTRTYYELTSNPVYWTGQAASGSTAATPAQSGWVLDLVFADPGNAQPVMLDHPKGIFAPSWVLGPLALINAALPATGVETCNSTSGQSFPIIVDSLTGGKNPYFTLDTNGDGKYDNNDILAAAGWSSPSQGIQAILTSNPDATGSTLISILGNGGGGGSGGAPQGGQGSCKLTNTCKNLNISNRVWRQLMNPPQ